MSDDAAGHWTTGYRSGGVSVDAELTIAPQRTTQTLTIAGD